MTQKPTFFGRYAIVVLMVVFFCVPFALRGARLAVNGMKNDVRDWLPKGFRETTELNWFRQHFLSEQFVVVSWEGCEQDDQRLQLFLAKLKPELPPSQRGDKKAEANKLAESSPPGDQAEAESSTNNGEVAAAPAEGEAETPKLPSPTRYVNYGNEIGDRYGLYIVRNSKGELDVAQNWGHRNEKWFRGRKDPDSESVEESWYYLTPDGDLFRWDGVDAPVASAYRYLKEKFVQEPAGGALIHSFVPEDARWYYEDPRRLRAQLFKTITTGPDVFASLTAEGGELADNEDEAKERLTGMLYGPDGKQTCLVLTLSDAAKHNLHLVLGRGSLGKPRGLLYEVAGEANISEKELRLGGPPVDNVAIDEEGSTTLFRLIGMTMMLGFTLSLACFRSISATIMVFLCAAISAVLPVAMMWWFGSTVDAIAMSMPAMVYVLGLSGATHLINYYHDAVDQHGLHGAPERSVGMGWKPNLMCNITTAIGLFSLYTSELIPIQKFGFFAGLGVLSATIIQFTYLPAALQIWPQIRKKPQQNADEQPWLDKLLGGIWQRLGGSIIRNHAMVSIVCILVIAAMGYGIVYIHTSVNMLKMFHSEAKIIKDYEWLEAHLGELVPMEIVVKLPQELLMPPVDVVRKESSRAAELAEQLKQLGDGPEKQAIATELGLLENQQLKRQTQMPFLERMELAARVQNTVQREFGAEGNGKIGRAMSAATFVRALPAPKADGNSFLRRGATSRRLEAHREEFLHSDYLRLDKDSGDELWRVSLRVGATKGIDYGELIHEMRDVVEPILSAYEKRDSVLGKMIANNKNKYPAGSKVLLLGAATDNSDKANTVNQTRIFSETLKDLLTVKRLNVKTFVPGVDEKPANWNDYLADFDCVVLIKDDAAYAGFNLQLGDRLVVDAKDHRFDGQELNMASRRTKSDARLANSIYTGVVPIVYKAQRSLLDSLIWSTFWSFITITPLMMFVSRSFWGGLVAMLPNVLPVLMVFGGMGWLKVDVDVGSMMCASIALGVAVDDTIHYLNWYREELDRLKDRKLAILAAYKHCATPTFQAAIISGLGLSVFALSTFTPTQRFGHLMLVILWMGVVAELIFFPALLAGPLGVVFKPRKRKEDDLPADSPIHESTIEALQVATTTEPETASSVPAPAGRATILSSLRQDGAHSRKKKQ